ncbi:MAG: succinate dehydrogenase/fumarate reductase transmembrane subunit [Planctomycetota bacterium]|jgi:fumarate reductase subunit D
MRRHAEALWWSLFSVGGVMAALFMPGFILATSFLLPTTNAQDAAERYGQIAGVVAFWPVRLVLLAVVALAAFHCAHRFRHILMDVGLRRYDNTLVILSYSSATAVSVWAGYVLIVRL